MGTLGFSYVGLVFLLLLFVPNALWATRQPEGYAALAEDEPRWLRCFERVGQVLCTGCALCFSDLNLHPLSPWALFLVAALGLMVLYEVCWARYFLSPRTLADFYASRFGVPVPLATLPVVAFVLLGVYGRVIWLVLAGLILGVGHVGIHLRHWRAIAPSHFFDERVDTMKVLVVGSGGREHAICWKLKQSPRVSELFCAPGNGGIAQIATCVDIKATDVDAMVAWAKENAMDFVVVAPDDPLALGMVDALEEAGIAAFGPRKNAAIIEASKAFSKELMKKYHIPTAAYETFTDVNAAKAYLQKNDTWPVVVKADGLALGKGVEICATRDEALAAVEEMMVEGRFGASGNTVVIEEFLNGPEVSVLAFTDGETIVPMVSSMDHKRAFDGNMGPNTGGMGTIAPNPAYTPWVAQNCMERIFLPTIAAMKAEGRPFRGCLYFGLMITATGPHVIEYNCRFGDPETQVVLPLLESDLLEIMLACRNGTLDKVGISWSKKAACCVVLASGGYPGSYDKGYPIKGLDAAGQTATVFHAGTALKDGQIVTNGGRVLGITATADTLDGAINAAYAAAGHVHFEKMQYRTDIGRAMR